MTISFLIGNLSNSGGTQRMLTLLCNELIKNKHITVFINQPGDSFFQLDSRVEVVLLKGSLLRKNIQMYKVLKRKRISYYINLDSNSILMYSLLLPRFTKLVLWEHFSLENNYKKWIYTLSRLYASLRACKIVVLSEVEKKLWRRKYKTSSNKIKVIYNPVNTSLSKEKHQKNYHYKNVLSIGNDIDIKGFDILVEAWANIDTDWELNIYGLPELEIERLHAVISRKNISNIHLFGRTKNINNIYSNTSLFILSSRREATPLVLIESQSFGIPVICFDHLSSVKEIAGDSVLYAEFSSPVSSLQKAIEQIIVSEELHFFYSNKSLSNTKRFSINIFINNWLEVFSK